MNIWHVVARSLQHNALLQIACALGVAVATAIITGALVIGDSVRDSLRDLNEERLGRMDAVLIAPDAFRAELAEELQHALSSREPAEEVIAAWILPGVTVAAADRSGRSARQSTGVTLVAAPDSFWSWDVVNIPPTTLPHDRQVVINQQLADELGVAVSDQLLLRLPESQSAPAETPFGRRDANVTTIANLVIVAIVPNRGFGRFALSPSQTTPRLLYADPQIVQRALGKSDAFNVLLVAGRRADQVTSRPAAELDRALQPQLADFGVSVERIQGRYDDPKNDAEHVRLDAEGEFRLAWQYWNITSRRLLFSDELRDATRAALSVPSGSAPFAQEVFTYLANSIVRVPPETPSDPATTTRSVPYSLISALEESHPLGPSLESEDGPVLLASDEILLNEWLASELSAVPGDLVKIRYFVPETAAGDAVEESITLRVRGIVPIVRPITPFRGARQPVFNRPPTRANDPMLTPEVDGVTDRRSIEDWDPPFPFDSRRIQPADDDYWDYFRTTPKAFVPLATGQRLWGSRFGSVTSFRIPTDTIDSESELRARITAELRARQRELGFAFLPIKEQGLRAATGTTPFEYLFLGFSLFLLTSALLMVGLLISLSLQARWREMGLLAALGWGAKQVNDLFRREVLLVTVAGACLGVLLGIGYAAVMTHGLRTWWVAATVAPIVHLSLNPRTLAMGWLCSLVICLVVAWLNLRSLRSRNAWQLLRGTSDVQASSVVHEAARPVRGYGPTMIAIIAGAMSVWGTRLTGETQAGAFFGAGALALAAGVLWCRSLLRRAGRSDGSSSLATPLQLASRSATRHVTRSLLIISLVAAAVYLLVAISAFRLAPTVEGTGGFQWIAQTDVPIFEDLADPRRLRETLEEYSAWPDDARLPTVVSFSVRSGDDASCRNLFQVSQPRLIGLDATAARQLQGRFRFAASEQEDPWHGVIAPADERGIPVILDQNTARFGLKLYGGIGQSFALDFGDQSVTFRIVGLLSNSILQGSLLIGTDNLHALFPNVSGRQYFLIESEEAGTVNRRRAADAFQRVFRDQGIELRSADLVLIDLLAIQNTYLTTFQTLGGLGLLLGTIGLAIVEIRNIVERRKELALLTAIGYSSGKIRRLVALEHFGLLIVGMLVGMGAALVTVLPQQWTGQAAPPLMHLLILLALILVIGWLCSYGASLLVRNSTLQASLRNY